jgi:hypothetical protein
MAVITSAKKVYNYNYRNGNVNFELSFDVGYKDENRVNKRIAA